jgi:hypothetical protein
MTLEFHVMLSLIALACGIGQHKNPILSAAISLLDGQSMEPTQYHT